MLSCRGAERDEKLLLGARSRPEGLGDDGLDQCSDAVCRRSIKRAWLGDRQRDLREKEESRGCRRVSRATAKTRPEPTPPVAVSLRPIDEVRPQEECVVVAEPQPPEEQWVRDSSQHLDAASLGEISGFALYHSPGILDILCGVFM